MSGLLRSANFIAIGAVVIGFVMVFIWQRPIAGTPNLTCRFHADPGQTAVQFGELRGPLSGMTLTGTLLRPEDGEYSDITGEASYTIGGLSRSAPVKGYVMLDANHAVEGLALKLEDHEAFGWKGLPIYTLNEDGRLNYNRHTAYAFSDPLFKFAHPLTYSCTASHAVEGAQRADQ